MRLHLRFHGLLLAGVLALLPMAEVNARTWTVAQDGSGDYSFLSQACAAAQAGDSVLIRPGTYSEVQPYIRLTNKPLSILGGGAQPDDTKLTFTIWFEYCEGSQLENICFRDTPKAVVYWGGSATMRLCAVRHCVSVNAEAAVVVALGCSATIEDCVFEGNQNVCLDDCEGAAIVGEGLILKNSLFVDNVTSGRGGAVFIGQCVVENCVFFRNTARTGAGASVYGNFDLRNCTFLANRVTAAGGHGGTIEVPGDQYREMHHLIIAGTIDGAGADCTDNGAYECCDFWDNDGGDGYGWCGIGEIDGDFSADPLFCDPEHGDVGLMGGSPCLPGYHGGVECGLIGAQSVGCGIVPIRETSWGMLKALYR